MVHLDARMLQAGMTGYDAATDGYRINGYPSEAIRLSVAYSLPCNFARTRANAARSLSKSG